MHPSPKQQNDLCWQITNRRSKGKVQFDIFTFQSGGKFRGGGKGQKIGTSWFIKTDRKVHQVPSEDYQPVAKFDEKVSLYHGLLVDDGFTMDLAKNKLYVIT